MGTTTLFRHSACLDITIDDNVNEAWAHIYFSCQTAPVLFFKNFFSLTYAP